MIDDAKMSFWNETEAKGFFQELLFYNVLIEKPKIKHLENIDLIHELSLLKIPKAFKGYARSYKIEIIDLKDLLAQSEVSKSSIKDLFKYLFDEMKGFNYEITVQVLLKKHKGNGDKEFAPVYINSATKTVINSE